jgi:hypothetical protein
MEHTRLAALRALIVELEQDCARARAESRSSQGLAALMRLRATLTDELHAEQARLQAIADEAAPPTEDDLVATAVDELARLPDPLLDRILDGLVLAGRGAALRRNAPPPLYAIKG